MRFISLKTVKEALRYLKRVGEFAKALRADLVFLDLAMPKWMDFRYWPR